MSTNPKPSEVNPRSFAPPISEATTHDCKGGYWVHRGELESSTGVDIPVWHKCEHGQDKPHMTTDIEKRLGDVERALDACRFKGDPAYAANWALQHGRWLIEQLRAQLQLHDTNLDLAINDRNYWRERAGTAERKNAALKTRVAELEGDLVAAGKVVERVTRAALGKEKA